MAATTHQIPGLILIDHEFTVPLDHTHPDGEQITIFAREVRAAGAGRDLPWLVFFQGGPGGKSPRPTARSGWIKRATETYRVLLLDQRGTGRSTPVSHRSLTLRGGPQQQADYLKHFRADSIIRDAELIRAQLAGPETPWSALGQSYGGFCITTYLSLAPHGLREAFITGGLPPIDRGPDEVYRATYRRVIEQNRRFFARYPSDQQRATAIATHLAINDVWLPDGSRLTPRRFQQLGLAFGASDGFESVHYLLEEAFVTGPGGQELGEGFLHGVFEAISLAGKPIFAILHEAIYCQGAASRWSAERVRAEHLEFEPLAGHPLLFTGEMIYPWMFDEDPALAPIKQAAEILASYDGWPPLYDAAQFRANTVPVAAAVYYDDMYVERAFSEETARAIAGCRMWLTNEHQHNALRADGEAVLGHLMALLQGEK